MMKKVVSASRRTDLVAFFPKWLADVLRTRSAEVLGPSGRNYTVDLSPDRIHTLVFWSKNFAPLIENTHGLKDAIRPYDQVYLHFTITGLGGTLFEEGAPPMESALNQLPRLIDLAGTPERLSLRFDPIVYWMEGGERRNNLDAFVRMAPRLESLGISDVRFSVMQWYPKVKRRWSARGFDPVEPDEDDKLRDVGFLAEAAREWGITLWACSQPRFERVSGVRSSSCIDGRRLEELHPAREPVSAKKDRGQRKDCLCTVSIDIGSYTQSCPHGCLYCYANPD